MLHGITLNILIQGQALILLFGLVNRRGVCVLSGLSNCFPNQGQISRNVTRFPPEVKLRKVWSREDPYLCGVMSDKSLVLDPCGCCGSRNHNHDLAISQNLTRNGHASSTLSNFDPILWIAWIETRRIED